MTLVIDATVGGASSNSFVTEAEQITYMAARLNATAWTTFTGTTCTEDEKKAMIEATRELSARSWTGERVNTTQNLSWPRFWALNPDLQFGGNQYFNSDIIPQRVKDGACELAFQFLNAGTTDVASLDPKQNIIMKRVGPIETQYANPYARPQGLGRFPSVTRYIAPLLLAYGSSSEVIRG